MINTSALESSLLSRVMSKHFNVHVQAAREFSDCYKEFAMQVMTSTGGHPTMVIPATESLFGALSGVYPANDQSALCTTMQSALMAFWQMQIWAGGVGPGTTISPGHIGFGSALYGIYEAGKSQRTPDFHASQISNLCGIGVHQVVVMEIVPGTAPPVTAPVI